MISTFGHTAVARMTKKNINHTCDIPRSRRVFPILTPFTRRAKFSAFSIVLSDFFADRPIIMATVIYGIVYARRRPQLKIQKD